MLKKNVTGRQLARISALKYGETLWSELYAGHRTTLSCVQPAVLSAESSFELVKTHASQTVWRLDGGSGSDDNLRWLLKRDYQLLAKGYSGKRAHALGQQVQRWDQYHEQIYLGTVSLPVDLGRPVTTLVKKQLRDDKWRHSYYVTTLAFSSKQAFFQRYAQRGAAEIEQFREDKSGLHLSARRKRSFQAQRALILLTDLAHNLLADFRHRALAHSSFARWGFKRIVRDLFAIPGRLEFDGLQLKRISLQRSHPYAEEMLILLERFVL